MSTLLDLICWLVAAILIVVGGLALGKTIVWTLVVIIVLRILAGDRPPFWSKQPPQ